MCIRDRRRSVPIRFYMSPVASLKSLSLSAAVLERIYCLYVYALRCDLELWPRDLDLLPLTLNICSLRLCRSETLYEIWAQSDNPWRSYCSLNFDLMTSNMYHVRLLCSEIVCTKFKLSQAIRSWNVTIFFTLICHVMLWPWPLTRWPWKFVVGLMSRGHSLW